MAGIHDRRVEASAAQARPADVQGAGAVAPLAADRPEVQRGRIAVVGAPGRRRAVDVTGQAPGKDDPLEMEVPLVVAGGEVVAPLLCVPGDRGLGHEPVALHQERVAPLARAEGVGDRGLDGGDGLAGVEPLLAVDEPAFPALDGVVIPAGVELRPGRRGERPCVGGRGDRRNRPAHRVRPVRLGHIGVAPRAGRVADVADPRPDIPERGLGDESGEPAVGRRRASRRAAQTPPTTAAAAAAHASARAYVTTRLPAGAPPSGHRPPQEVARPAPAPRGPSPGPTSADQPPRHGSRPAPSGSTGLPRAEPGVGRRRARPGSPG